MMKGYISGAAIAALLAVAIAPVTNAQQAPPPPATEVGAALLAIPNLPAKSGARLTVSTPAFAPG
ncbi:MAG TPA: hypothetical protein VN650_13665, partial [Gemmatimonadaceae bacterium]|nr:hypothetical protein [Gemmatimonadaceae bacterium]